MMEHGSNPNIPTYIGSSLANLGPDREEQMANRIAKNLKWARLSLGGAIIGYAVAHAIAAHLSPDSHTAVQSVGAISGTAVAAVLAKVAHIV